MCHPSIRADMLFTNTSAEVDETDSPIHTFKEIRLQVDFKDIPTQSLYRIVEWQDMNSFAILDIKTLMNIDEVTKLHS